MVNRRYEAQWMGKGKDILLVRFCCNTDLLAVILKTAGMVAEANGSGNEQTFSGLLQHRDF